jgi:hypothetical protein
VPPTAVLAVTAGETVRAARTVIARLVTR